MKFSRAIHGFGLWLPGRAKKNVKKEKKVWPPNNKLIHLA
jgi:hypothetical protein